MKKAGFLFFFFLWMIGAWAQDSTSLPVSYKRNEYHFKPRFLGFFLLNSLAKESRVFLISDEVDTGSDRNLQIKLFYYLNAGFDVGNLIVNGLGKSEASLLERYMRTGDSLFLRTILLHYHQQELAGLYAYYSGLYRFNKALPDRRKIKLVGVDPDDADHFRAPLWRLTLLLPKDTVPASLKMAVQHVYTCSLDSVASKAEMAVKVKLLYAQLKEEEPALKKYLKEQSWEFISLLQGIYESASLKDDAAKQQWRYQALRKHILYEEYGKQPNYFGCFEAEQVLKVPKITFAGSLQSRKKSPVMGKVCSIALIPGSSLRNGPILELISSKSPKLSSQWSNKVDFLLFNGSVGE